MVEKIVVGEGLADDSVGVETDSGAREVGELGIDNTVGKAELGNTVFEHTANFMESLENIHLEAAACHLSGERKTGGA